MFDFSAAFLGYELAICIALTFTEIFGGYRGVLPETLGLRFSISCFLHYFLWSLFYSAGIVFLYWSWVHIILIAIYISGLLCEPFINLERGILNYYLACFLTVTVYVMWFFGYIQISSIRNSKDLQFYTFLFANFIVCEISFIFTYQKIRLSYMIELEEKQEALEQLIDTPTIRYRTDIDDDRRPSGSFVLRKRVERTR